MNTKLILMAAGCAALSATAFAGAYSGGLGTQASPYQISTAGDWQELANTSADWNAWFFLTNDIDLAGASLTPVGNNSTRFTGKFNGNRRVLRNLTMISPTQNYLGLFGYIGAVGEINDLGVVNVNVHGREAVGGLVGRNHGTIRSCYVTGAVRGDYWDTGGLVGSNIGGAINACYAAVAVVSISDYVGGLAGYNLGDVITTSYASGSVSGMNYVGGFIGANDKGQVIQCYSTGVTAGSSEIGGFAGINWGGSISSCFWDRETSGRQTSGGGTGKTTDEMKTLTLYVEAGWDFDHVWSICQEIEYPKLKWQILPGDFACPQGVSMEDFAFLSDCWLSPVRLTGDLTENDRVAFEDFLILSRYWLLHECGDCGYADLNGDGAVELDDLLMMSEQWLLTAAAECGTADLNGDGVVEIADLLFFTDQWLLLQ